MAQTSLDGFPNTLWPQVRAQCQGRGPGARCNCSFIDEACRASFSATGQNAVIESSGHPPLTSTDDEIPRIVESALEPFGDGADTVTQTCSDAARMWIVDVAPARSDAAPMSVAFGGDDLLSAVVGRTWLQMFPLSEDLMAELREIVESVLAGHLEEAGWGSRSFANIGVGEHMVRVGHVHLPVPWAWRLVRRFVAYG